MAEDCVFVRIAVLSKASLLCPKWTHGYHNGKQRPRQNHGKPAEPGATYAQKRQSRQETSSKLVAIVYMARYMQHFRSWHATRDIGYSSHCCRRCSHRRSPRSTQSASKLNILLLDCDALGVDGAQICVVEEVDEEGLSGLLEGSNGLRLPSVWTVVASYC